MRQRPNILIYREDLLGASETFILGQAESLKEFRPIYVGLREVPGLSVPQDRKIFVGGRRLASARLKLMGPSSAELKRLRALKPALVHAHFGMDATRAMLLARGLGVPLVATFHGYDATVRDEVFRKESLGSRLYVHRRPKLAHAAARIVCVSNFIRREMLIKHFPEERTQVHFIGSDVRYFSPAPHVKRQPIVLFVGRLVPKKGCSFLIDAMARVQKKLSTAKLAVIGAGPLRERLMREASSKLRHFEFLGCQPPPVVREWMNRSQVFSTPSIVAESGDTEGFGMVFTEAQSMGLPVASFATGGIPEAVSHGETGWLAPAGDSETLATHIESLLEDATLWRRFSDAGRERVHEHFDIAKQTEKLEQIYHEALA